VAQQSIFFSRLHQNIPLCQFAEWNDEHCMAEHSNTIGQSEYWAGLSPAFCSLRQNYVKFIF
jgi:hypothetical protein